MEADNCVQIDVVPGIEQEEGMSRDEVSSMLRFVLESGRGKRKSGGTMDKAVLRLRKKRKYQGKEGGCGY